MPDTGVGVRFRDADALLCMLTVSVLTGSLHKRSVSTNLIPQRNFSERIMSNNVLCHRADQLQKESTFIRDLVKEAVRWSVLSPEGRGLRKDANVRAGPSNLKPVLCSHVLAGASFL